MPVDDLFAQATPLSRQPSLPRLPRLPFSLPNPADMAVRALNALLRREGWARAKLVRHAGKTVRLTFGAFQAAVTFTSEGHAVVADPAIVPDVTVTLAAEKLTLARLLSLRQSPDGAAIVDITHISGDAGLAQVVGELARHLRWDIEDELAGKIGDVPAARLTQAARAVMAGARSTSQRLGANVAEYLSEERKVLVGKPLFEEHRENLAQTIDILDALEARIKRLSLRTDRP